MKNAKTQTKLLTGFGLVAIMLVLVSVLSIYGLTYMSKVSDDLHDKYLLATESASEIDSCVIKQLSLIRGMYTNLTVGETDIVSNYASEISQLDKSLQEKMAEYAKAVEGVPSTGGTAVASFDSLYFGAYTAFLNEAVEFGRAGDADALLDSLVANRVVCSDLENYLEGIVAAVNTDSDTYNLEANSMASTLTWIVIIVAIIAVAASVFMGFYNSSLIAKPLQNLTEKAKEVALGNTDVDVEVDRKDEIGMLSNTFHSMISEIKKQSTFLDVVAQGDYREDIPVRSDKDTMNKAINKMVESNNEMIAKIRMSSEQVSSASSQIAQAAQTLASGTTEQAASVDEFTSTLNDILEQTNKNALLSADALEHVNEAVMYMQESTQLMSELLGAMNSIDESSRDITKVIKTIEDIAFQTNILALNAAVEAARAGQHGKGFAVVAEEVRSLASGSSVAAKETAELIESSAQRVKEGNELVEKTNVCMQNVADSASKVQSAINLIATASQQQTAAIGELHQGLEQISQVVQANSATSEQTAASAEEMSSQAAMLDETVAEFKLSDKYDKRLGGSSFGKSASLPSSSEKYSNYSPSSDFGKY